MSRTGASFGTRPIPGALAAAMKRGGMTVRDLARATRINFADVRDLVAARPDEVHSVDYRRRVAAALGVVEDDLWIVERQRADAAQVAPPAPSGYFVAVPADDTDDDVWTPPAAPRPSRARTDTTQAIDANEMIAMRTGQEEP